MAKLFFYLTDEKLIEKMTFALQKCYKNAKIDHDLTSKRTLTNNILTTPSHLKEFPKFLGEISFYTKIKPGGT